MTRWILPVVATVGLALPALVLGQEMAGEMTEPVGHAVVKSDAVAFAPIEIPGFDSGMQIAVVHGNPEAETGDYTLRLKFPAGYRFPVHWHPMAEHLTVLEGKFLLAMGKEADPAAIQSYTPGAFIYIPAEHPHYGGAEGETVIQLHGQNPFKILMN